jgi:diguanylate cyclase (GGDEF)-like protein/PAS domain S-box-containing protein
MTDDANPPPGNPPVNLTAAEALRQRAQAQVSSRFGEALDNLAPSTPDTMKKTVFELRVHQIELEMQNEELRQVQAQLESTRARYKDLFELAPVGYLILDAAGLILNVNLTACGLLGQDRTALLKQPLTQFIPPQDQDIYYLYQRQLVSGVKPLACELRFVKKGDSLFWTQLEITQGVGIEGLPIQRLVMLDINERKLNEKKIQLAASVFTYAREGIMITAADGTILDVNEAFSRITGYSHAEVLGRNPRLLRSQRQDDAFFVAMWRDLNQQGYWFGEIWNQRKNGEVYAGMQTISAVRNPQGQVDHYVALFSDITEFKEHERQLEYIAHYDALTGLPNRSLLMDRLNQAMAQALRHGKLVGVAFIDLDGFKAVNDRYGHDVGDRLLVALSLQMKHALREGDTLARLGGDEFVALFLDLAESQACAPMLARLVSCASEPVYLDDIVLQVSASLGVTFFPQAEEVGSGQLLRQADQAMYQAKMTGRNRYHIFDAEQDRQMRGHHESLDRIRQALVAQEFVLHYQPMVNMRSGQLVGVEALIRWQHPQRGLMMPGAFLPVVEDHPLAVEIGEWVLDAALQQMGAFKRDGLSLRFSVNISSRHLQLPDFAVRLKKMLARHPQLEPGLLELEVLETSALEDLAHVSQLIKACREMGVLFALDDFGTGYSSLNYMKRLPVNVIKIDQSFVRGMLEDTDDLAILDGVITLSAAFGHEVIAEGVESVTHGRVLLQLGCELGQGYFIAKPMPAADLMAWASGWKTEPQWLDVAALKRDDLPLLFGITEHQAWIEKVRAVLSGERDSAPLLDPKQCRLGRWLEAEGPSYPALQPAIVSIGQLHQQLHAQVVELLTLREQHRPSSGAADAPPPALLNALLVRRDVLMAEITVLLKQLCHRRPVHNDLRP